MSRARVCLWGERERENEAKRGLELHKPEKKLTLFFSNTRHSRQTGILNPANIVLDAYVAGKARYYLRRHALRTAAVLATACLLIDGLKAAAAAAAKRAAASGLAPFPQLRDAAAAAAAAAAGVAEEQDKAEAKKEEEGRETTTTKTTAAAGEEAVSPPPRRRREGGRRARAARHLLRLAASGAVAVARKAVDAALPTPLLAAWLVAELML